LVVAGERADLDMAAKRGKPTGHYDAGDAHLGRTEGVLEPGGTIAGVSRWRRSN
jgi:hypothetical protein